MTSLALTVQRCEHCGRELPERDAAAQCPDCDALFDVVHAVRTPGRELLQRFASRHPLASGVERSGVWRYRELVLPSATDAEIVSWPEGNTPLLSRDRVAEWAGVPGLLIKHEGMNPTGSFKDRGMTVGLTQARRIGARAVACASTGNTSASLAAYAAHAGIPALVFVPAGKVAPGKLAQTLAYGATAAAVRGDFDRCLTLIREASTQLGLYLLNSVNPFRIEGQKTIVFELLEQLDWKSPDWIVLPAGNLGNTAAFGKALREAHTLGLIARMPRIAAVQAEGAAPFARGFREGFVQRHAVQAETVASAIRIGAPASWDRAVRAIRQTRGVVTTVSDEQILEAKSVIDRAGIGCEPASAASVAGVRRLTSEGVIAPDDQVVAVLTGNLLKDPSGPSAPGPIVEIDGTLDEVRRLL